MLGELLPNCALSTLDCRAVDFPPPVCPTAQPERTRTAGPLRALEGALKETAGGGDGAGAQVAGAGVLAVDPPGAAAAREPRAPTRRVAEPVMPTPQLGSHGQRRRFQIVAVVADRPAPGGNLRSELTAGPPRESSVVMARKSRSLSSTSFFVTRRCVAQREGG